MYINENMGQKIDTRIASLTFSDNRSHLSFKVFMLIAINFLKKLIQNSIRTMEV
jgi:hypothetical protein